MTSRGLPHSVPLGEAAPIDDAVDAALAALKANASTERTRAALQRLDVLVVSLLRDQLAEVSHWAAFIPAGDWRPLDKNTIRSQRHTP